ncbi:hypothetical protein L1286_16850 [Pseudoalteromonas sp. SMS1]|uniref:hypothetical protein n=1 Tax=Pseudoalteromonas sp. SMS1 TaxID=2908894 RepID=UPI001F25A89F|nr:hypothetical protein [Pseudoalteromonas sp. SMS1]MCF2859154.1 hypothetical protein [Pseudoalteromonas sp. SMS1]
MKILLNSVLLLILLLLAGCKTTVSQLQDSDLNKPIEKGYAIGIIKVRESDADSSNTEKSFYIHERHKRRDGTYTDPVVPLSSGSTIMTKDHIAIFKFKLATRSIVSVIASASHVHDSQGGESNIFASACGGPVIPLQASSQGVYYFGEITFKEWVSEIGELKFDISVNDSTQGLEASLSDAYPSLSYSSIKVAPAELGWDSSQCQPSTTIIYI